MCDTIFLMVLKPQQQCQGLKFKYIGAKVYYAKLHVVHMKSR